MMTSETSGKILGDRSRRSNPVALTVYCLLFLSSPVAFAGTTFGIYDARTLAMGGTSVASANNDNAQFYNAALLAFNDEIEEQTEDSRFLFPLLIPQAAEAAITIEELSQNDATQEMTRAVSDFNAAPDSATAQNVVNVAADLDASLADIDGKDLFVDIYVGMAVSEPGDLKGAGFFLGTRLLAGGRSSVTTADRALLATYQEGLAFVASDGIQGVAHPELFDANGALIDPGSDFDSTVTAAGAVITEAGVAMSRQIHLFGKPVAAGISFKVQHIDTFEDVERVVGDRIDARQNSEYKGSINFDIGLVKEIGERWRIGLAVKDIIPHGYITSLGTHIRLRPRARIGAAYQLGRLQIATDIDLTRNEPLGGAAPTQEAAFGAEWALGWPDNMPLRLPLKLRAGYRHDIRGGQDGILSFGIGTVWKRLAVDLAYAGGSEARAAALQIGVVF